MMLSLKVNSSKQGKPTKTPYKETLLPTERSRYEEKLKVLSGSDPYELKNLSTDVKLLPAVTYPDIVNYLVFTPSPYTLDDLKCYKGLEAYNQFICGWVSGLSTIIIDGKHLVKARVLHSQRMRETALSPWVVAAKEGTVLASHCTCMAGVGETCTHIASVLFAIEGTVKIRDSRTVTQEPAYWLLPSSLKTVSYMETKNIDFSSAKTLKKRFDLQCTNPPDCAANSSKKVKRQVPEPTEEELSVFFKNLRSTGRKPALLSIIQEFSDEYIPKVTTQKFPIQLPNLKDKTAIQMTFNDLLEKCKDIDIVATEEEIGNVEKATKSQSEEKMWFDFHAGRITASNMKAVFTTDISNPSQSLIKKICYPSKTFANEATKWGLAKESYAKAAFMEKFKDSHVNAVFEESGLHISSEKPFIAASPDGMVTCNCCGISCIEIKCPYSRKGQCIDESLAYMKKGEDGNLCLDNKHSYFYQIQTQLGVTKLESCYFIVWTEVDMHIEEILFDNAIWRDSVLRAETFFRTAVLPELVGKFYSRLPGSGISASTVLNSSTLASSVHDTNQSEKRWCYCDQVESGRMICCDSENCKIVWFHFTCLKMTNEPKRKIWYCPECRKLPEFSGKRSKVN